MSKFIKRTCTSKRETVTYIVIILWVYLGILSVIYDRSLEDLSVFFLSLTGFIGSYIVGESMRKSKDSSIFLEGKNSRRETITYLIIIFWTIIGSFITIVGGDIIGAASYFGSLTPFVGAFVIGNSYVGDVDFIDDEENVDDDNVGDSTGEGVCDCTIQQINS